MPIQEESIMRENTEKIVRLSEGCRRKCWRELFATRRVEVWSLTRLTPLVEDDPGVQKCRHGPRPDFFATPQRLHSVHLTNIRKHNCRYHSHIWILSHLCIESRNGITAFHGFSGVRYLSFKPPKFSLWTVSLIRSSTTKMHLAGICSK